jgi:hypothetical protein
MTEAARRQSVVLGAALVAAPLLAWFALLAVASVEVPYIDDYDAVVDFLMRTLDEPDAGRRMARLLAPHNEHPMLTLRSAVLATWALGGGIDFGVLNALGGVMLAGLVGALFCGFATDLEPRARLLPFAPASLFLVQPEYWMVLLSSTTSLSSVAVTTWAAWTFVLLERGGTGALAAAAVTAFVAAFSLGNGVLVPWLGAVVLLLRGRKAAAALLGAVALATTTLFVALMPEARGPHLGAVLAAPGRLVLYGLNFVGTAASFSLRGLAAVCGAALTASAVGLVARGLPRRRPALFALLLFMFGSIGLNALARAGQGAGAPLLQPRYSFYGAVILAVTWLGWAELLRDRPWARRAFAGLLAAAVLFSVTSFAIHQEDVFRISRRLEDGIDTWLTQGNEGLVHPDFLKASMLLTRAYDRGLMAPPRRWVEEHAGEPIRTELPDPGGAIRMRIDAVYEDDVMAFVSGWAFGGGSAINQQVAIVLHSPRAVRIFGAHEVPRADLTYLDLDEMGAIYGSGFRAIVPKRRMPPGTYRVGVLVRRGSLAWVAFGNRKIHVAAR